MEYQTCEYGDDIVPPYCLPLNKVPQSLWDALQMGERHEVVPHTEGRDLTPGSQGVIQTVNCFGALIRILVRYAPGLLGSKLHGLHSHMDVWRKEFYMLTVDGEARALPTHEAYCLLAMSQIKEQDGPWDNCRRKNRTVAKQHMHVQTSLVQASLDAWSYLTTPLVIKDRSQHPVTDVLSVSTTRSIHHAITFFLTKMIAMVAEVEIGELDEDLKCPRCYFPRSCEQLVKFTLTNGLKRHFTWCQKCAPVEGKPKVCGLTRVQGYEDKKRKRESEGENALAPIKKPKKRRYLPRRRGLTQEKELEQSALRLEMAQLLIKVVRTVHPEYFEGAEE